MKDKYVYIAIFVMCFLILAGAGITVYMLVNMDNADNYIEVHINEENAADTLEFRALAMKPGQTVEYTIDVYNEVEGNFDISLELFKTEDGGKLGNYVYAYAIYDGKIIFYNDLLEDLITNEKTYSFPCVFQKKKPQTITVRYYMPETVDNSAQGETVSFDLVLTASNQ